MTKMRQLTSTCLLVLLALVGACETGVDPATGRSRTVWTVPLTQANAARAESQWRQCTQFRSESYCARNLPAGRPLGVGGASPLDYGELTERPNDP